MLVPDGRAPMPPAPTAPDGPDGQDRRRRQEPPAHVPEPDVDDLREGAARVARDRPGRAHRRAEGRGQEGRRSRRWSARSIASPDGKYVRVTRMVKPFSYDVPVEQLRPGRRGLGRGRQGAREADRPADQPRRAGRHAAAGRSAGRRAAAAAAAAESAGQARDRVAHRRPGPDLPRAGAGAAPVQGARAPAGRARRGGRGGGGGGCRRPTRAARRARSRSARIASISGCRRSTTPAEKVHLREQHAHDRASASRPT